ncbi:MAG: hypothetical protein ACXWVH_00015 [Caulobacteraceae bacterium]
MGYKVLTAAAAAALMLAAGGQAFAQSGGYGGGSYGGAQTSGGNYGHGDPSHGGMVNRGGYDDADFGREGGGYRFNDNDYGRFSYNDFGAQGRFYQGGDVRARTERLEHFIRWQVRSGRINRWEASRAQDMLQQIRRQARVFRMNDGRLDGRERSILNARLDRLVQFLRNARRDHDDPADYGRRH